MSAVNDSSKMSKDSDQFNKTNFTVDSGLNTGLTKILV